MTANGSFPRAMPADADTVQRDVAAGRHRRRTVAVRTHRDRTSPIPARSARC